MTFLLTLDIKHFFLPCVLLLCLPAGLAAFFSFPQQAHTDSWIQVRDDEFNGRGAPGDM